MRGRQVLLETLVNHGVDRTTPVVNILLIIANSKGIQLAGSIIDLFGGCVILFLILWMFFYSCFNVMRYQDQLKYLLYFRAQHSFLSNHL